MLLLLFVSFCFVLFIDIITRASPPGVSAILSIFSSLTDLHPIITGYAQLVLANPLFPFFAVFFAIKRTHSLSRHLSVFSNHWGVSPVYLFHYILLLTRSSIHYLIFQVLLLNLLNHHISVFSNHWGYTLSYISVPKLRFPCICYHQMLSSWINDVRWYWAVWDRQYLVVPAAVKSSHPEGSHMFQSFCHHWMHPLLHICASHGGTY